MTYKNAEDIAKEASSKSCRKHVRELSRALGVRLSPTDKPSEDWELLRKIALYRQERLNMADAQKRAAGKLIRHPRLDKTRRRRLPI